jgi:hypothetical protein
MRILLILLFILVANSANAKSYGGKKICVGFCEGEEYVLTGFGGVIPISVVKNEKKKKLKFQRFGFDVGVKKSWCSPFFKQTLLEPKQNDPDKILEFVEERFDINTCIPCPPEFKKTSSGYCPFASFQYKKIYEKAYYFNLYRSFKNFNDAEVKEKGLLAEYLKFSISVKKDLVFFKYFSKSQKKYLYEFMTFEYKTPFKQQETKTSVIYKLRERKFQSFVDELSKRMENSWDSTDFRDPKNHKKLFKKLYGSIPTSEEINFLIKNFSVLRDMNVQTRN